MILQNRTQDIEAFKDKYLEIQSKIDDNKSLIDSYQEKVDYYNKLKDQWNEISSAYEKEQQRMYAAQILGANWEKDVLDGRLDVLSQFRDQYLEIQRQMTQAALDGARARNDAAASGGTGGSGGSSGGGGGSTPIQNQQAYHVLHLVGGYSTSGEASSKISSFNGKGVYKYKDGKWYVYKEEDYSNLSFGSKSEADDYIKKHLSPAGKFLVKYYHNGLENGLVDFSKKDSNFDLVQKYGLKKYEVPAILKQGEAVMNQEQIKNLGEALRAIPTAATLYTTPDYTKMLSSLKTIRAKDIYDTCFCNILYDEAKVDISLLSISNIRYCKLKATEDNSIYVIYKELTDSSATHTKDSIINFEIHRINGIFSLKAYYA